MTIGASKGRCSDSLNLPMSNWLFYSEGGAFFNRIPLGILLTLFFRETRASPSLEYCLWTSVCAVALYISMASLPNINLAGKVDLCIVKLTKVIVDIVMFKEDVLTNASRPGSF